MSKKKIYQLHRLSGVTLGVLLFLMALSGVGISFREELMPKVYPELFHIQAQGAALPVGELFQRAQKHLGAQKKISNLYGSEAPNEAFIVLYKSSDASFPGMLTVNPYTGEAVGEMSMIKNFFAIMLFMHSNFFLGKAGSYLVGCLGLVLLFFVFSGLYIWWPKKNASLKLKKTFSLSRFNRVQKLHHSLGLGFGLLLIISGISGFLTVFDLSYSVMRPLRNEAPRTEELERKSLCTFEEQLRVLQGLSPTIEKNLISIHFCTPKSGLMKVSYGLEDRDFLKGYGRLIIDPVTNTILQEANSSKDPSSWNIKRLTVFPIHTGEYLGMPGRILVFLTGLALMGIFCTGLILFLRRRRVAGQSVVD